LDKEALSSAASIIRTYGREEDGLATGISFFGCGISDPKIADKKQYIAKPKLEKSIQKYYKCPCGGWDQEFGCTKPPEVKRIVEIPLNSVKKLTGTKPKGCPWYAVQFDPFVKEVLHIFNLAKDYPHMFNKDLENIIYDGIVYYRNEIQKVDNFWTEFDNDRIREATKKRRNNGPSPGV